MVHPSPEFEEELNELRARQVRPIVRRNSLTFTIPTPGDVENHVEMEHGASSWRFRAINFLHQKKIQYFMMGLLVLDVIILFVEVTLMALFPHCSIIQRDAISCVPTTATIDSNATIFQRLLAGGNSEICSSPDHVYSEDEWMPQYDYPAGCDTHKWEAVHIIEEILFILTMIILCTFFVELNALLVVLKPGVFFRQVFYVLDYFIITVSIVLEAILHALHYDLSQALVGMMVVLRSWRYVRISHGIIDVTVKLTEPDMNRLLNYTEHLESIIQEHGLDLEVLVSVREQEKIGKIRGGNEPELMAKVRRHHAEEKRKKKESNHSTDTNHSSDDGTSGTTGAV